MSKPEYNSTKQLIRIKKEKRIPVKIYKVKKICPECGGEMNRNGMIKLTSPPQYAYICKDCGYKNYDSKEYPYIEYEEEE